MQVSLVKTAYGVAVVLALVYAVYALRGPNGVAALMDRREQIRKMETGNAELARRIEARRERINRLKEDQAEQELEIRQRLKLVKPGEKVFILQENAKSPARKPGARPARGN